MLQEGKNIFQDVQEKIKEKRNELEDFFHSIIPGVYYFRMADFLSEQNVEIEQIKKFFNEFIDKAKSLFGDKNYLDIVKDLIGVIAKEEVLLKQVKSFDDFVKFFNKMLDFAKLLVKYDEEEGNVDIVAVSYFSYFKSSIEEVVSLLRKDVSYDDLDIVLTVIKNDEYNFQQRRNFIHTLSKNRFFIKDREHLKYYTRFFGSLYKRVDYISSYDCGWSLKVIEKYIKEGDTTKIDDMIKIFELGLKKSVQVKYIRSIFETYSVYENLVKEDFERFISCLENFIDEIGKVIDREHRDYSECVSVIFTLLNSEKFIENIKNFDDLIKYFNKILEIARLVLLGMKKNQEGEYIRMDIYMINNVKYLIKDSFEKDLDRLLTLLKNNPYPDKNSLLLKKLGNIDLFIDNSEDLQYFYSLILHNIEDKGKIIFDILPDSSLRSLIRKSKEDSNFEKVDKLKKIFILALENGVNINIFADLLEQDWFFSKIQADDIDKIVKHFSYLNTELDKLSSIIKKGEFCYKNVDIYTIIMEILSSKEFGEYIQNIDDFIGKSRKVLDILKFLFDKLFNNTIEDDTEKEIKSIFSTSFNLIRENFEEDLDNLIILYSNISHVLVTMREKIEKEIIPTIIPTKRITYLSKIIRNIKNLKELCLKKIHYLSKIIRNSKDLKELSLISESFKEIADGNILIKLLFPGEWFKDLLKDYDENNPEDVAKLESIKNFIFSSLSKGLEINLFEDLLSNKNIFELIIKEQEIDKFVEFLFTFVEDLKKIIEEKEYFFSSDKLAYDKFIIELCESLDSNNIIEKIKSVDDIINYFCNSLEFFKSFSSNYKNEGIILDSEYEQALPLFKKLLEVIKEDISGDLERLLDVIKNLELEDAKILIKFFNSISEFIDNSLELENFINLVKDHVASTQFYFLENFSFLQDFDKEKLSDVDVKRMKDLIEFCLKENLEIRHFKVFIEKGLFFEENCSQEEFDEFIMSFIDLELYIYGGPALMIFNKVLEILGLTKLIDRIKIPKDIIKYFKKIFEFCYLFNWGNIIGLKNDFDNILELTRDKFDKDLDVLFKLLSKFREDPFCFLQRFHYLKNFIETSDDLDYFSNLLKRIFDYNISNEKIIKRILPSSNWLELFISQKDLTEVDFNRLKRIIGLCLKQKLPVDYFQTFIEQGLFFEENCTQEEFEEFINNFTKICTEFENEFGEKFGIEGVFRFIDTILQVIKEDFVRERIRNIDNFLNYFKKFLNLFISFVKETPYLKSSDEYTFFFLKLKDKIFTLLSSGDFPEESLEDILDFLSSLPGFVEIEKIIQFNFSSKEVELNDLLIFIQKFYREYNSFIFNEILFLIYDRNPETPEDSFIEEKYEKIVQFLKDCLSGEDDNVRNIVVLIFKKLKFLIYFDLLDEVYTGSEKIWIENLKILAQDIGYYSYKLSFSIEEIKELFFDKGQGEKLVEYFDSEFFDDYREYIFDLIGRDYFEKYREHIMDLFKGNEELILTKEDFDIIDKQELCNKFSLFEIQVIKKELGSLERLFLKTEEEAREIFEILKDKGIGFWQDNVLVERFERGAEIFGYRRMFEYAKAGYRHDALYAFERIIRLYEVSGLSHSKFFNNILRQVSKDTGSYDGMSSYMLLNRITENIDAYFKEDEILDFLEKSKKLSEILQTQNVNKEIVEGLRSKEDIFSKWKNLVQYYQLVDILKSVDIFEELLEEEDWRLKSFIGSLLLHSNIGDKEAVRDFWKAREAFFERDSSNSPYNFNEGLRVDNLLRVLNLDLYVDDLRDALVEGSLDRLQEFRPLEIEYRLFEKREERIMYSNFMQKSLREIFKEVLVRQGSPAKNVKKLFKEIVNVIKKKKIEERGLLEINLSKEMERLLTEESKEIIRSIKNGDRNDIGSRDLEEEIKKLIYFSVNGYNKGMKLNRYKVRLHLKSSIEGILAGNDTQCCMPFGDGKNTFYDYNPLCALLTVEREGVVGYRTIAQSVLTLNREIDMTMQDVMRELRDYESGWEVLSKLGEKVLLDDKNIICCDSVEVPPNYSGDNYRELLRLLYEDFFQEYISRYGEEDKLLKDKVILGRCEFALPGLSEIPNMYIPETPLIYTDNKAENTSKLDIDEEERKFFYGDKSVKEIEKEIKLSERLSLEDERVKYLSVRDVIGVGYIEHLAYRDTGLEEGLFAVHNTIVGMLINNEHKGRPNLSLKYEDEKGKMVGYLVAYEGRLYETGERVIYIRDIAKLPGAKQGMVSLKMLNEFFRLYYENYIVKGKYLPILAEARGQTTARLLSIYLDRFSRRYGSEVSYEVEELDVYKVGEDEMHQVKIIPILKNEEINREIQEV